MKNTKKTLSKVLRNLLAAVVAGIFMIAVFTWYFVTLLIIGLFISPVVALIKMFNADPLARENYTDTYLDVFTGILDVMVDD